MAEINYPPDSLWGFSDSQMEDFIRMEIEEAMIVNCVYLDRDDLCEAIDRMFPLIVYIIFNPSFSHIRRDEKIVIDLITYLVTHLA